MNLRSNFGSLFAPLLAHEFNQQGAMQRAAVAQAQGLDVRAFGTPYPGSQITSTNTTHHSGRNWLPAAVLGAALFAGGSAAVLSLPKSPAPPAAVVTPNATPPAPSSQGPPAGQWMMEQEQPDGTWKQIEAQSAKENPDGTWTTPDGRRWQKNQDGSWGEVK